MQRVKQCEELEKYSELEALIAYVRQAANVLDSPLDQIKILACYGLHQDLTRALQDV